ncbi:hypothetical protein [Ewingella americana]
MTRQQSINSYKLNGFINLHNNLSGISTDVLIKNSTVVRIGSDPGYAHFARLVISRGSGLKNVVNILDHDEPLGLVNNMNNNGEYSITKIELLTDMSQFESDSYKAWAKKALNEIITGTLPETDPFDLVNDIKILAQHAEQNNLLLDLIEPKNVMKRGSEFIILDPFF